MTTLTGEQAGQVFSSPHCTCGTPLAAELVHQQVSSHFFPKLDVRLRGASVQPTAAAMAHLRRAFQTVVKKFSEKMYRIAGTGIFKLRDGV